MAKRKLETFGGRVRSLRLMRGLGVNDLSRATGTAQGRITHIERGDVLPSLPLAWQLARSLHVSLDELVRGTIVEMDQSMPRGKKTPKAARSALLRRG